MIFVGIDDTDTPESPGTNQLARSLVKRLELEFRCVQITRHQLFFDPRVPYTSKNGSASILLEPDGSKSVTELIPVLRQGIQEWFQVGSDPGLCVTESVPEEIINFGQGCQRELITQVEARQLAHRFGVHLEGLGGTNDGIIGALAAVGLIATGNDGRIVQLGSLPDDLSGKQSVATILSRGIEVRCIETDEPVRDGEIDVGKHLRPNYRGGKIVLFVTPKMPRNPGDKQWQAVRLT